MKVSVNWSVAHTDGSRSGPWHQMVESMSREQYNAFLMEGAPQPGLCAWIANNLAYKFINQLGSRSPWEVVGPTVQST